jgi:hypothetical protein
MKSDTVGHFQMDLYCLCRIMVPAKCVVFVERHTIAVIPVRGATTKRSLLLAKQYF